MLFFSTTLNISSSATDKPNQEEHKVTIYAVYVEDDDVSVDGFTYESLEPYLNKSIGMPIVFDYNTVYSLAKIDNDNFNISNLKVSLYPGSIGAA